jgi:hypothetical protein
VTQPGQGILLELANAFVGEAKLDAQLPQGARWMTIQAIASHHHLTQAVRELREEGEQSLVDPGLLDAFVQVFEPWPRRLSPAMGVSPPLVARALRSLDDSVTSVATDSHPGIGREGCASRWVVVQNGPPEADATDLQGLLNRSASHSPHAVP